MTITQKYLNVSVRFDVLTDGEVITNGSDLAKALNFSNPSLAITKNVWAEYRFKHRDGKVGSPTWYLTEPGVWQLIFKADEKEAVKVQKWVFETVLPSIRVKGGYIDPKATLEQVERLQEHLKAMNTALREALADKEALRIDNAKLKQSNDKLTFENRDIRVENRDIRVAGYNMIHAYSEDGSVDETLAVRRRQQLRKALG